VSGILPIDGTVDVIYGLDIVILKSLYPNFNVALAAGTGWFKSNE